MSGKIFIGTSGWSYDDWKEKFYPENLKSNDWLNFYADYFNSVEINNSFYQLPSKDTLKGWFKKVPSDFVFSIKASRYITHLKKLKDPKDSLKKFLKRIKYLGHKRGPILFQLPPNWHINTDRLKKFIKLLLKQGKDETYVFEFRDPTWLDKKIKSILKNSSIGFCINDMIDENIDWVTSNLVYIRFHGPNGYYAGKYKDEFLKKWAKKVSKWRQKGKRVFVYFNNDIKAHAIENGGKFKELIK